MEGIMRPEWCEDLSSLTLEEMIGFERENRAWRQELRIQNGSLVDDRLAKRIGAEQYAAGRRAIREESAECSRRQRILIEAIESPHRLLRGGKTRSQ